MEQIKISAISYLNTAPFVYGLKKSNLLSHIELTFDTPSVCAMRLQHKQADLGIVPVAAIPRIPDAKIVSDYCIGADGAVRTVVIAATSPIEQIKHLYIDPDSRTSALLAQVLLRDYWKVSPRLSSLEKISTTDSFQPKSGYVLIGDKVFDYEGLFPYIYDLAAEWKQYRNMPFVFATWTAVRTLSDDFLQAFNLALDFGVKHIRDAVREHSSIVPEDIALNYLFNNIHYTFDGNKQQAMMEFLELISNGVGWKTEVDP